MLELTDTKCLERMVDLVGASEDWLLERVMSAAVEHGYEDRSPRTEEAWRDSIRGLSDALFQAVYSIGDGYAEGPARHDPVVAYGVVRARTHGERGVTPARWLGLLRFYRQAYLDLVSTGGFEQACEIVCGRFIDRVFDRFELGFCTEWAAISRRPPLEGTHFSPIP